MHVQLQLYELRGPQTLTGGSFGFCCNKIAEAEAVVSVNEKNEKKEIWLLCEGCFVYSFLYRWQSVAKKNQSDHHEQFKGQLTWVWHPHGINKWINTSWRTVGEAGSRHNTDSDSGQVRAKTAHLLSH